jgi:uncharacterized protein YqeY
LIAGPGLVPGYARYKPFGRQRASEPVFVFARFPAREDHEAAIHGRTFKSEAKPVNLKAQLTEDMKTAMKGGDKDRLGVIRLVNAAIKQREVDERIQLDDTQVLGVLEKMLKQRRDSFSQFQAAGRMDLADKENFEIGVIQAYLPQQLTAAEVDTIIAETIAEAGAAGPKDMGKVMGLVKPKVAGRTDMGKLSELVKARLSA